MNTDNIIQVEYINEAKVTKIVTRKRVELLKENKLPVAKISKLIPVIPKKEYTHYRIRIRFFREENEDDTIYKILLLIILYFFVNCYIYITVY